MRSNLGNTAISYNSDVFSPNTETPNKDGITTDLNSASKAATQTSSNQNSGSDTLASSPVTSKGQTGSSSGTANSQTAGQPSTQQISSSEINLKLDIINALRNNFSSGTTQISTTTTSTPRPSCLPYECVSQVSYDTIKILQRIFLQMYTNFSLNTSEQLESLIVCAKICKFFYSNSYN